DARVQLACLLVVLLQALPDQRIGKRLAVVIAVVAVKAHVAYRIDKKIGYALLPQARADAGAAEGEQVLGFAVPARHQIVEVVPIGLPVARVGGQRRIEVLLDIVTRQRQAGGNVDEEGMGSGIFAPLCAGHLQLLAGTLKSAGEGVMSWLGDRIGEAK